MKKKRFYTTLLLFGLIIWHSTSFSQPDSDFDMEESLNHDISDTVLLDQLINEGLESYKSDPMQALKTVHEALNLAIELGRYEEEAKCDNIIGAIYERIGQYDSSFCYYKKTLAIGLAKDDNLIISEAYGLTALHYFQVGLYDSSLIYSFKALPLYEKVDNSDGIAKIYANIGNTYIVQNSNKDALVYLNKSLLCYKKIENKRGIAATLNSLGIIYCDIDSMRPYALKCYQQSIKIYEELNDQFGISNLLGQMATLYKKDKNYEKESELLEKAVEIKRELGDRPGLTKLLINSAHACISKNNYEEALSFLSEALILSEQTGNYSDRQQVYLSLSYTYEKDEDYKMSLHYRLLYSDISDTILNLEKQNQIIEMQTKYKTEKKQQENELLARENEIKTLEIDSQRNQRTVLIIVFAFIVIAGAMFFNRIRLKQQNKILMEKKLRADIVFKTQEEEKIHLAKELHDGLGPLLSLIKLTVTSLKKDESNEKVINDIKELASEGLKEVRNISHTLMPSLLENKGLEPALKEFIVQINQAGAIEVEFVCNLNSKLTQDMELNLYRIVQESLQNVIKHAEATKATVHLTQMEKVYQLVISDNGKGFDTTKTSAGIGLSNIYSRVDFLNGKVEMTSEIERGTKYIIQIPSYQKLTKN